MPTRDLVATSHGFTLLVSTNADRSAPVPLEGQAVVGSIYVFTSPDSPDISRVRFWLDDPAMSGSPRQTERSPPYDFVGGTVSAANSFDTTAHADGTHTITARVDLAGGGSEVISASFSIANSGPQLAFTPASISAQVDESGTSTSSVQLIMSDGSSVPFAASGNATWLSVVPDTGTTPATPDIVMDASGLSPGFHTGTITATSAGLADATLDVTLLVGSEAPSQIHLAWVDDPSTALTVIWRTLSIATPSVVQYRPSGTSTWQTATGNLRPSGTAGTLHEVELRSLTPATQYEYRVQGDESTWSEIFTTVTAPPSGPADFDAIYVADTGILGRTDGLTTGTQQVIDEIAALAPLLVLGGGDYAYFNTDERFATLDHAIDAWFDQMQPIFTQSVFMPTYGNHEMVLGEGYSPWADRFPTPEGHKNRQNYSFDVGDAHFISIMAFKESKGLTQGQLDWIRDDILAAQSAGQRWIIPYFHVAPFSDGSSHPSNLALRSQLGPLFEEFGLDAVLFSHDQNYERTYPLLDVPASNTPTSSSLTCYSKSDGVTWIKTSPGGKLSNKNGDFSKFTTDPAPARVAYRDDTMHHFIHLSFSASGSITFTAYGVVGDGSPPIVQDTFEYVDGACGSDPGGNQPPTVDAGADQTLTLPDDTADLLGSANDDGLPDPPGALTFTWSGPAGVVFGDPTALATTATFPGEGVYTLTLTADDSELTASDTLAVTVEAEAGEEQVVGLVLINADTDQELGSLQDGDVLDLNALPTRKLNVRADTIPATVGSVRFGLDADSNFRTENSPPYALAGDRNGDYRPWTPSAGSHTLTATPYSERNAGGSSGSALSITFEVIDN